MYVMDMGKGEGGQHWCVLHLACEEGVGETRCTLSTMVRSLTTGRKLHSGVRYHGITLDAR